jgi:uncharacterized membrane protein (UPF0127 family)
LIKVRIEYIMEEKMAMWAFRCLFRAFFAPAFVVTTTFTGAAIAGALNPDAARAAHAGTIVAGGSKQEKFVLSLRGRPLTVEVARSETARRMGLMGRKTLPWNEGMLFVFESDQELTFWMKNTQIPLSIAFLDHRGQVRDIFDMIPYDESPVSSTTPCRYALEVNRGFFDECGLVPGDRIDLSAVR